MLIVYKASTGAISSIVSTTVEAGELELAEETADISRNTHYVTGTPATVTERPETQASLDGHTLTAAEGSGWNLKCSEIGLDTYGTVGEDGEVEFDFEDLGTYQLLVTNFPDKDFEATIVVT